MLLVVAFGAPMANAKVIDRTVVVVNQEVILESDVDKFINKMKSKSFQELFGGIDERTFQNREAVLQLMIEEKIIDQQVLLDVSEAHIKAQLDKSFQPIRHCCGKKASEIHR